jgi:hypothetical protein
MEINYCLKKGKGKGNLYLPSFVVTLFCRRAFMSHALLSRALFAARFCRDTRFDKRYPYNERDIFNGDETGLFYK